MHYLNNLLVVPIKVPTEYVVLIIAGLFIVVVGPVLAQLWKFSFRPRREISLDDPSGLFELRPYLLTEGEHAFLPALEQAIGNQYRIVMKVRLGDLVNVRGHGSAAFTARNKTWQRHVDFVLCSHYPVKPLLVIELDDASHDRPERQQRDDFVDNCMACVKLPIYHVRCQQAYDVGQLAADIQALIGRTILKGRK